MDAESTYHAMLLVDKTVHSGCHAAGRVVVYEGLLSAVFVLTIFYSGSGSSWKIRGKNVRAPRKVTIDSLLVLSPWAIGWAPFVLYTLSVSAA